jgi:RimJ/RimL family protein N-acetyltransferase
MMAYARTALGLKHLISGTARQNLFSARVLEKLGFVVTAEEKGSFISDAHGCAIALDGLSLDCQL